MTLNILPLSLGVGGKGGAVEEDVCGFDKPNPVKTTFRSMIPVLMKNVIIVIFMGCSSSALSVMKQRLYF